VEWSPRQSASPCMNYLAFCTENVAKNCFRRHHRQHGHARKSTVSTSIMACRPGSPSIATVGIGANQTKVQSALSI